MTEYLNGNVRTSVAVRGYDEVGGGDVFTTADILEMYPVTTSHAHASALIEENSHILDTKQYLPAVEYAREPY